MKFKADPWADMAFFLLMCVAIFVTIVLVGAAFSLGVIGPWR